MSIFEQIGLSIFTGVISSGIFLLVLTYLRPSVKISPRLCKGTDPNGVFYGFKILNTTQFDLVDVKFEMMLKTPFNSNGGQNTASREFSMRKNYQMYFPKINKNDAYAGYAVIAGTREDVEALWTSTHQFIVVRVQAKHSLSGITKTFVQNYYTKTDCIKVGLFGVGSDLTIS